MHIQHKISDIFSVFHNNMIIYTKITHNHNYYMYNKLKLNMIKIVLRNKT